MLGVFSWIATAYYEHFSGKKQHVAGIIGGRISCCEAFYRQETTYLSRVLQRRAWWIKTIFTEDTVCWDTILGRGGILTARDKDIAIWTTFCRGATICWRFRQPGDSMIKSCYELLERSMLKVFCRKKCALSRNGVLCSHETTCSTRNAVQSSMLKTFLLGKKHMLKVFR